MDRKSAIRSLFLLAILFALGCDSTRTADKDAPEDGPDASVPATPSLEGVRLKLVVVDQPGLAEAARRRHALWQDATGAEFDVVEVAGTDFERYPWSNEDVLVYPATRLGALREQGKLRPFSPEDLDDERLNWPDVFELLRSRDATWGAEVVGLPLGTPILALVYRPDLFEAAGLRVPSDWDEFHAAAKHFGKHSGAQSPAPTEKSDPGASGVVQPLGPGWAVLTLLARAAPYAQHPDYFSALFDSRTMAPQIASPPFTRALEELIADSQLGSPEQLDFDPAMSTRAVMTGKAALAIGWLAPPLVGGADTDPTSDGNPDSESPVSQAFFETRFAPLPGSKMVFHPAAKKFEAMSEPGEPEIRRVTLLGVGGWLASTLETSKNPRAAVELARWLASGDQGARLAATSESAAMLARSSQVSPPWSWAPQGVAEETIRSYAETVAAGSTGDVCLQPPRIPGRERYLAALDEAVRRAVRGEQSAAQALAQAADAWRAITEELGVEKQREAYRRSFGPRA